jgi:hypothetical protein
MNTRKMRLYIAGLLAFLIGMPLTEQAFAQTGDIINASLGLAGAIVDSAGRS